MKYVLGALIILVGTGLLKIVVAQSYNFLFVRARRPMLWVLGMFLLGYVVFVLSHGLGLSEAMPQWWLALTVLASLPPRRTKLHNGSDVKKLPDDVYAEMGIQHGRHKYRLGLVGLLVGGYLGLWVRYS